MVRADGPGVKGRGPGLREVDGDASRATDREDEEHSLEGDAIGDAAD